MKAIVISVILAIALGVAIMLAPVLAFTYVYPAAVPADDTRFLEGGENNQTANSENGYGFLRPAASIAEAAQTYGTQDVDSTSLPSSLLQAVPIMATGLITAFVALLYFKWKSSQT